MATEAELPLDTAGSRLARAREAAGLTRAQLAAQTRIPERHLAAIETGDYAALPGRTYAVGFSRTYARVLGLDDNAIVSEVRAELAAQQDDEPRRQVPGFEPGDPARVPSRRLVWIAVFGIVAVLALVLVLARGMILPSVSLPSILPPDQPAPAAAPSTFPGAPAAAPAGGPVVFTALQDRIWVKFTDAAGNQLLQKELAQGESWTVPEGAGEVKLWTARPEALSITIGGKAVPKLSEVQQMMKEVPVSAAALLARGTPAATPAPQPSATSAPTAARSPVRHPQHHNPAEANATAPAGAASPAPSSAPAAAPTPAPSAT